MSSRPTARSDRLDCSGELGRVHAADIAGVSNAWIVVAVALCKNDSVVEWLV